jgi:hypothetical protein
MTCVTIPRGVVVYIQAKLVMSNPVCDWFRSEFTLHKITKPAIFKALQGRHDLKDFDEVVNKRLIGEILIDTVYIQG